MLDADLFSERGSDPAAFADQPPRVLSVHGATTQVGLTAQYLKHLEDSPPTVGKFLGIRRGKSLLIGMITEVTIEMPAAGREQGYHATARLDLLGEILDADSGQARFQRGVTNYPAIGDPAALMTSRELRLIYDISGADTINIGSLHQDPTIGAYVAVDEMLHKHFAVLGATGVGKSSGVVLILQQIMKARPELRIFLLDGHNEYGRCFGDRAHVLNPGNLKLPFWLFNFEELVDVIFGARPGVDEEIAILQETIPLAKVMYTQSRTPSDRLIVRKNDPKSTGFTVDTPVPYRLDDLLGMIDDLMGKLENRSSRLKYFKLLTRIETVRNDPRYTFMFDNANVGGDTMAEVLRQLFRLQPGGKSMTVMQLAGFPVEVVDSVVSVLCRMAFDFGLWSDGARAAPLRLRGGAPLRLRRPVDRFRADPAGAVAHRQGRPQIRRVPRPRHPASGRARRHHHLAVLDALCHAHGQRPRPGASALGRLRCGRQPARLHFLARHTRGPGFR